MAENLRPAASADVIEGMREARLRVLLLAASQYVADAGSDEDPETQRQSQTLLADIRAALACPGLGWRLIAEAPKDRDIIVFRPNAKPNAYIPQVGVDWWMTTKHSLEGCWARSNGGTQPTLWCDLPSPPALALPDSPTTHKGGKSLNEMGPDDYKNYFD